jgi:anti-sigma factor RsiW
MDVLSPSSVVCDRVRAQVSLALDGELSQLEQRMLSSHLLRCPECSAYQSDVESFTRSIRSAPLEQLRRPVVIERRRRYVAVRLRATAAAAAVALVALGLGGQLASSEPQNSSLPSFDESRDLNPPRRVLEQEQAILHTVRPGLELPPPGSVL